MTAPFGCFFCSLFSVYPSASEATTRINEVFMWFSFAGGVIFLAVVGSVTYILIRFNRKRGHEPSQGGGSHAFEITSTLIALALVGIFMVYAIATMSHIQSNKTFSAAQPDLIITGHQWWWDFYYPKYGFHTANELYIPAGGKLLAKVLSADVIHSWWVRPLGRKMDLIPGNNNWVTIQADKPGVYEGACSEFCGQQHAWMRIKVFAQQEDEFEKWVSSHQQSVKEPVDSRAREGKKLFMQKSCSGCHFIRGLNREKFIGPELTHLASRKTLLAGLTSYSKKNLKAWLRKPSKVKPGAHMPDFIFTEHELDALTAYLDELK